MKKLNKLFIVLIVVFAVSALFAIKTNAATLKDITYDGEFYLVHNPDVAAAYNNDSNAAYEHYLSFGINEGRAGSPLFDVNYYLGHNKDLQNAFGGNGYVAAYNHFVTTGVSERRSTSKYFDVNYYIENNADLKSLAFNPRQAYDHYLDFGINEGRDTADWIDMSCYAGTNSDVKNAFNGNWKLIARHLFNHAVDEGRRTSHLELKVSESASTCTTAGETVYACLCGEVGHTEKKALASHSLSKVQDAKDATCTEDGLVDAWKCSTCGKYFSDENGKNEISEADLTVASEGKHALSKVQDAKDATCTEDGLVDAWKCSACGKFFSDENGQNEISEADLSVPAKGHDYNYSDDEEIVAQQVIDENGQNVGHSLKCKVCGQFSDPQDHSIVVSGAVDPTCTSDGFTGVSSCSVCGAQISEGDVIPATNHANAYDASKPADCKNNGIKDGTLFCPDCNNFLIEKNGQLVVASEDECVDPADLSKHAYVQSFDWNIPMKENAPEVDTDKMEVTGKLTCSVCGDVIDSVTTTYDKKGHDIVNATCKEDGSISFTAKFTYKGKTYEETKTVTLPAGHTITYEYAKIKEENEKTTIDYNSSYGADTEGVTHHKAKCSKCGLYMDNDWVKCSSTEYVNSKENPNVFVATCECGHTMKNGSTTATQLRWTLNDAKNNDISVVRIAYPYWQDDNKGGIHVHVNGNHAGNLADTETAIKIPAGVTLVVDKPEYLVWDGDGDGLVFEVEKGGAIVGELSDDIIVVDDAKNSVTVSVTNPASITNAVTIANGRGTKDSVCTLNITLKKDVELSSEITVNEYVNMKVTGAAYENTEAQNGKYYTIKSTKYTKQSMNSSNKDFITNNGNLTLSNVAVRAQSGSGVEKEVVAIKNSGTLTVNNGDITSDYGTGIVSDGELVDLTNTEITSKEGAGIEDVEVAGVRLVENSADNKVEKLVLTDSKISHDNIGIVGSAKDSSITLSNTVVEGLIEGVRLEKTASGTELTIDGGAVKCTNGLNSINVINGKDFDVDISNCTITSTTESGEEGLCSAVVLAGDGNYVFTNCTIEGATGIQATQGTITVNGGSITANGEYDDQPFFSGELYSDGCAISLVVGASKYKDSEALNVVVDNSTKLASTASRNTGRLLQIYDKGNDGIKKVNVTAPLNNNDYVITGKKVSEIVINNATVEVEGIK